mmetsp:Transcript_114053/g.254554  ORF Transcript_114053/g.254554 Transcript_114053/m.254554 type:complete len:246 (+) Transcript_114053:68-805(+)
MATGGSVRCLATSPKWRRAAAAQPPRHPAAAMAPSDVNNSAACSCRCCRQRCPLLSQRDAAPRGAADVPAAQHSSHGVDGIASLVEGFGSSLAHPPTTLHLFLLCNVCHGGGKLHFHCSVLCLPSRHLLFLLCHKLFGTGELHLALCQFLPSGLELTAKFPALGLTCLFLVDPQCQHCCRYSELLFKILACGRSKLIALLTLCHLLFKGFAFCRQALLLTVSLCQQCSVAGKLLLKVFALCFAGF